VNGYSLIATCRARLPTTSHLSSHASALSDARFDEVVSGRHAVLRAFDKAVRRKPPVAAADAGPMEMESPKTAVRSVVEALQEGRAGDSGNWLAKVSVPAKSVTELGE
jgi:hypothetical protein